MSRENIPSAFGSGFDVQDFYKPFTLEEITPQNMQEWPYYNYVSAHWERYALQGTAKINRSLRPEKLESAGKNKRFDMNSKFRGSRTFIDSLQATQVKGFVAMKNSKILAEYYDNGFMVDDTNLLQSASKTPTAIVVHKLIEEGKLDPDANVENYLKEFKDTSIGIAKVQQVLDMTSGMPTLLDLHTPGSPGQLWEVEIGLQPGRTIGHSKIIASTVAESKPGEDFNYTDMNTDVLGLLAEQVSKKKMSELLSELFNTIGANIDGSIALTSSGTSSPNYGVSMAARDYALFHQWIAQKKGPKSYYVSAQDKSKKKIQKNEVGQLLGGNVTYGSQSYYLPEHDVIYSSGSYGQLGYSDMISGASIVFFSDWAVNAELDKYFETRDRAFAVINHIRSNSE